MLLPPSDRKGILQRDEQQSLRCEPSWPQLPETRPLNPLADLGPAAAALIVASEGRRRAPFSQEKWVFHMLREECHGPDDPEIPPGNSGIWAPVKSPLVFKCIFRRIDWRTGRCLICLPCHVKESLSSTDHAMRFYTFAWCETAVKQNFLPPSAHSFLFQNSEPEWEKIWIHASFHQADKHAAAVLAALWGCTFAQWYFELNANNSVLTCSQRWTSWCSAGVTFTMVHHLS